jgi:hypothetical protein
MTALEEAAMGWASVVKYGIGGQAGADAQAALCRAAVQFAHDAATPIAPPEVERLSPLTDLTRAGLEASAREYDDREYPMTAAAIRAALALDDAVRARTTAIAHSASVVAHPPDAREVERDAARITLTKAQARHLLEWFGDDDEPDADETEMTIERRPDALVVCWFTDYPEEGYLPLDGPPQEGGNHHGAEVSADEN